MSNKKHSFIFNKPEVTSGLSYQAKYLKYKEKYLALKNQYGGSEIQIYIHEHIKEQEYIQFPDTINNPINIFPYKTIKDLKEWISSSAGLFRNELPGFKKKHVHKWEDFAIENQILKIKCDDDKMIELDDECTLEAHGITNGTNIYIFLKNSKVDTMKVAMIGDSTIDNIVWVSEQERSEATPESQEKSVSGQLRNLMKATVIDNLAADGFTTHNVLDGGSTSISFIARQKVDPFPNDGKFKPLNYMEGKNYTHAVLSIGGNNIREVLLKLSDPNFDLLHVIKELQKNYKEIVEEIRKKVPNLILMTQYQPSMIQSDYNVYKHLGDYNLGDNGLTPQEKMHLLMHEVYEPIFALAQQKKLPIIDLTNSFNPFNKSLYVKQIEPSEKGGKIIATLIQHVLSNHNFDTNESTLYRMKEDDIHSELNQGSTKWIIDNYDVFIGKSKTHPSKDCTILDYKCINGKIHDELLKKDFVLGEEIVCFEIVIPWYKEPGTTTRKALPLPFLGLSSKFPEYIFNVKEIENSKYTLEIYDKINPTDKLKSLIQKAVENPIWLFYFFWHYQHIGENITEDNQKKHQDFIIETVYFMSKFKPLEENAKALYGEKRTPMDIKLE